MMERSIHKLDDTLQEIIDYSKNARKELTVEMVDLAKMVQDNLEKMEFMPGAQLIKKTLNIETASPFASDAYRISVILNNLISNAIKYADPNKNSFLNISIVTNDEQAELVFEDNGIGIDPAYVNRVFDMFFRATMQKEGAGLGLYIVKETIDKLHGEVTVDSKPGKGTTFRIKIPNLFSQLQ